MKELVMLLALLSVCVPASALERGEATFWGAPPPGGTGSSWQTDLAVGASQATISMEFDCTGNFLACLVLDGYTSTRVTPLSGFGFASVIEGGSWELGRDKFVDPPGLTAWLVEMADVEFDTIIGVGTPSISDAVLFGTSGGPFQVPGLTYTPSGPIPISASLTSGIRYDASLGLVSVDDEVVGPEDLDFTGTFEMLDATHYEVRDLTVSATGVVVIDLNPGTLTVTVDVVGTVHLSGETAIRLLVNPSGLVWSEAPDVIGYDVVVGDLVVLRDSGGDFTDATIACPANDHGTTELSYPYDPGPGQAIFLLVRGVEAAANRTYDAQSSSQAGSRDAEIDASSFSCP